MTNRPSNVVIPAKAETQSIFKDWFPAYAGMTGLREGLNGLAAVELTLFCVVLAMILVFFGTLAQVRMGTFEAQKQFFNSWWIYGRFGDIRLPVFPGGLAVGALWMVNLVAAFIVRFEYHRKDAGVLLSHFGVIVLLLGQFLTQALALESQMPIEIGHTSNYSEGFRETELALVNVSDPQFDQVTAVPSSLLSRKNEIALPSSNFVLRIRKFYRNARLGMAQAGFESLATQGIGPRIAVQEIPPVTSDEEANAVTAYIEVLDAGKSLGTWLLSSGLGAPQGFQAGGQEYRIALRPRRHYYPYALTLKEFHHDIYPGTDIPRNFSSVIHLSNPSKNESRDALIYMNHPLRYEGNTFYQASFGKGDRVSVLQIVRNPAWRTPYISCLLVVFGLALQFLQHLFVFARKRR